MATTRICSVPGCGKPHNAHGYCNPHYMRFRRHGDPLGGSTANGDPLKWLIDNKAHKGAECLTWPFSCYTNGYGQVWFEGHLIPASRAMCILAHGKPPSPDLDAAHSCGNGHLACTNPTHIRWDDRIGNMADAIEQDRTTRGERNHHFKLTEADVREIRSLSSSLTQYQIADYFNVNQATINDLLRGRTWAWLD